jgi:hypothetical protein
VVRHPAARPVEPPGHRRAGLGQPLDQAQQRLVARTEAGRPHAPVVHLGVDVQRVVRGPRRAQLPVPDPLQVRRRPAARPRRAGQQVPAELHDHRGGQLLVLAAEHVVGHVEDPGPAPADGQLHAAEQGAQVGLVLAAQPVRAEGGGGLRGVGRAVQVLLAARPAASGPEVGAAGRARHGDQHPAGAAHRE